MNPTIRAVHGAYLILGMAGLMGGMPATAQAPSTVTVSLADSLPAAFRNYEAVIVLHDGQEDSIVLRRSAANGELLDAAVRTLLHARSSHGLDRFPGGGEIVLGVRPSPSTDEWAQRHLPAARSVIARLRNAPNRDLGRFGSGPSARIQIPGP